MVNPALVNFTLLFILLTTELTWAASQQQSCTDIKYGLLVRGCQAKMVVHLQNSTRPFKVCSDLYSEAKKCIEHEVEYCYGHLEENAFLEEKQLKLRRFGDVKLHCERGGLRSIEPIVSNATICPMPKPIEKGAVEACETPFYSEFTNNPASENLCNSYAKARVCQDDILLSACGREFKDPDGIYHKQMNPALSINLYCPEVTTFLLDQFDVIEKEEGHAPSIDVIVPVTILAVLITIGLIVGICYMRRRDDSVPKTDKKTQQTVEDGKVKSEANQPTPVGEEMVPLSTISNEKDGISSA